MPSNLLKVIHPRKRKRLTLRASVDEQEEKKSSEKRSFLTLEEAGLVEMSGLSSHEGFLCRLTISSLNLLRVIGEQEGCSIEELNAGKVLHAKKTRTREKKWEGTVGFFKWYDEEYEGESSMTSHSNLPYGVVDDEKALLEVIVGLLACFYLGYYVDNSGLEDVVVL
ncbi:unnamed protein product [Lactuca saligna]|uniref:Uncharacterized protein n=1 Tax=Lactuca saligna TaxID=75948 RepID=A0AA36EMR9_LACSI|nr:unnamed protein product [Lactuca saligna]